MLDKIEICKDSGNDDDDDDDAYDDDDPYLVTIKYDKRQNESTSLN